MADAVGDVENIYPIVFTCASAMREEIRKQYSNDEFRDKDNHLEERAKDAMEANGRGIVSVDLMLSTMNMVACHSGIANLFEYANKGDGQALLYLHYDCLGIYAYTKRLLAMFDCEDYVVSLPEMVESDIFDEYMTFCSIPDEHLKHRAREQDRNVKRAKRNKKKRMRKNMSRSGKRR
jgi:hypothetical protein